ALSTHPDPNVLLFTLAVSLVTGTLFGLAPGLLATRPDLAPTLKDEAAAVVRGASAGLRKALVVAQVALSVLLLVGAGLFLQSLNHLKMLHPGFEARNLVTFEVEPTLNGYKPDWARDYYRQLTERLEKIPGVRSATFAVVPLLGANEWDNGITIAGYTS